MLAHYLQKIINSLVFCVGLVLFMYLGNIHFAVATWAHHLGTLLGIILMWAPVYVMAHPCEHATQQKT